MSLLKENYFLPIYLNNAGTEPGYLSGRALGYGLDNRVFRVPAGPGNFLLHRLQPGSGAHPNSYPMSTRGSFPEGKAGGV